MNTKLTFADLDGAIFQPTARPTGTRLRISAQPSPFVAPPLEVKTTASKNGNLEVEVLFLEAPAAVGKSTVADTLSASRGVPVLNLAKVRVSTGALAGIINQDFPDATSAQAAFHQGQLPLIIDALDEGRMFSGEQHIEDFLQTTFALLLQNRAVTTRPKLIFLGRPEAQGFAKAAFELYGEGITSAHIELGYFDEGAARSLIDANARVVAEPDSAYFANPVAVTQVIDEYFKAIEGALGITPGQLWSDDVGRAFAGYAPVLGALGHLLAKVDNFSKVATRLRSAGTQEAWQVIETVVATILEREQIEKFRPALAEQIGNAAPQEAYDPEEQLRFLAYHIDGQQLTNSGRVGLTGKNLVTYLSMAQRQILDHPFVRQGKIANSVLASLVLVDGVLHDRFRGEGVRTLEHEARQPFVWQAIQPKLEVVNQLVDGKYVGHILNSLWSDTHNRKPAVRVRPSEDGQAARVTIAVGAKSIGFDTMVPLTLAGQIRDTDANISGKIRFDGNAARGGEGTFRIFGARSTIVADEIEVTSDTVILEGDVWLEADSLVGPGRLDVVLKKGARVGWGGAFTKTYPWNVHPSTLAPPPVPAGTRLAEILMECVARFPVGHGLNLYADYTPVEDDPHTKWTHGLSAEFATMIRLLVSHGLATSAHFEAGGARRKVKVSVAFRWADLEAANRNPATATQPIRDWLDEARRKIG